MNSLKTVDRSIMLTTHILEEAEILSDRIGILSRGQLVKVGTSAELKSGMGRGYKITILMNNKDMEKNIQVVKRKVAGKFFTS
jgi:ATP-binding cassette subfamily A (ABC1) protein 3